MTQFVEHEPYADAFFAAIVENSSDAIVGKTLEGVVISWNAAATRIFGYSGDEMIGQSIRRLIPAGRQDEEDRILDAIRAGQRVPSMETQRLRKDGALVDVAITVSPVRDHRGKIVAASKIARDITESLAMRRQLYARESEFRVMADNIAQLAWIAGPDGQITWYNQRWYEYTGSTFAQMQGSGWQTVLRPDLGRGIRDRYAECIEHGVEWEDTFPLLGADGEYRWFLSRAVPIRDDAGNVTQWFGTNTDITERLDAQRRIELLLMEVNHRSRNLLAVVQSLVRQTVAGGGDVVERLEHRIAGLSANQDLLVERSWSDVPVRDLIEAQLKFLAGDGERVTIAGPELMITPSAAEPIAMAIHEMATNAIKFGALSVPEGRVAIDWTIDHRAGADPIFRISWQESEGPAVREPEREGFGGRIIRDVPRSKLRGEVEIDYAPDGFRWTLSCPAAHVTA
jgi:PAS domain S-box-containing protein